MHVPDGVLSLEVCLGTGAASAWAVTHALRKMRRGATDGQAPLTGMVAALVFAGQLVNFPLAFWGIPAVSGHLLGGVLATALVGPWAGCVAMTLVLLVQCLLFADGGILALGANVMNMAVVACFGGHAIMTVTRRIVGPKRLKAGVVAGAALAAWLSLVAAAALFCLEFRASQPPGRYDFRAIVALMLGFHAVIGLVEAAITGSVLSYILAKSPYLGDRIVRGGPLAPRAGHATTAMMGLLVALAIAACLAPFASTAPDGLEAVAKSQFPDPRPARASWEWGTVAIPALAQDLQSHWSQVPLALAGILGVFAVLVATILLLRPNAAALGARDPAAASCPPSQHALLKLAVALPMLGLVTLMPPRFWPVHAGLMALCSVGLLLGGMPPRLGLRRGMTFLAFASPFALIPLVGPLGTGTSHGTSVILLRMAAAFILILWATWDVAPAEFVGVLEAVRAPAGLTNPLRFMLRFHHILGEERDRMRLARRARTFHADSLGARWRAATDVLGRLAMRALHRAERVQRAVAARSSLGPSRVTPETSATGARLCEGPRPGDAAMGTTPEILALMVSHLDFRYGPDRLALSDVSFTVRPGESVALVGPSGAGKSTLLWHLNGLLPGDAARRDSRDPNVWVLGQAVGHAHLDWIRRRVGLLFQDPDDQLFCPTVGDDVAFGPRALRLPPDAVAERVATCLAAVGLEGFAPRATDQLSVGERKRVCLAGVLACHPAILALDEPTSHLDPRAKRQLGAVLKAFPGCQIIATHDLDFALEHCGRVLVLDEGRLCADGPAAEVLADEALMLGHGLEVPWRLR